MTPKEIIDKIVSVHPEYKYNLVQTLLNGVYFRYDTDDNTVKENESMYFDIAEEFNALGLEIFDLCIEHDCISFNIREKADGG